MSKFVPISTVKHPNVTVVAELQKAGINVVNSRTKKEFHLKDQIFDQIYEDPIWLSQKICFIGQIGQRDIKSKELARRMEVTFKREETGFSYEGIILDADNLIQTIKQFSTMSAYRKEEEYLAFIQGKIDNSESLKSLAKVISHEIEQH